MTSPATPRVAGAVDHGLAESGLRWFVAPVCASVAVAVAAHIAFPLPFTPVPFTLQPLAVLGVALALRPWQAAVALCLYLLEGALGVPVFSPTGVGGVAQLLGPTGGFLLAYPAVAWLCSTLTDQLVGRLSRFAAALLGCTVSMLLLFAAGSFWLGVEAHLTVHQTIFAAVLPFLPGEAVKVFAAAGAYRALSPSTAKQRTR